MSDNTEPFARAMELASEGKSDEAAALYRAILAEQPKHLAAAKALADLVESGAARGNAAAARKAAVEPVAQRLGHRIIRVAYEASVPCRKSARQAAVEHVQQAAPHRLETADTIVP